MEKEELELEERVANIDLASHKGIEKLDAHKLQLNWGQEELEQWAAASARKEEDALALEKYKRADEARVRELNLAIGINIVSTRWNGQCRRIRIERVQTIEF